jgi:hypothetical protein
LELKFSHVPVSIFQGTKLEAESLLIDANIQRVKTAGQKAREATELLRIEKVRAVERENAGVALGPQVAKGRASDIVAKLTGQSRATVEKQAEIVSKAEAGSEAAREVLATLDTDNCSLAEAYRELKEWEQWEEEEKAREAEEAADETPKPSQEEMDKREAERRRLRDLFESNLIEQHTRLFAMANEIVSIGVKKLALTKHPDVGGSNEEMQVVNQAAQWLRDQISRFAPSVVSL